MFERFTSAARSAVVDAEEQARRLGSDEVRPEHLLLAVATKEGVAARVLGELGVLPDALAREVVAGGDTDAAALRSIGVDLSAVRRQAEAAFGSGALSRTRPPRRGLRRRLARGAAPGHLRFSGAAKRALEQSLRQAVSMKHRSTAASARSTCCSVCWRRSGAPSPSSCNASASPRRSYGTGSSESCTGRPERDRLSRPGPRGALSRSSRPRSTRHRSPLAPRRRHRRRRLRA